MSGVIYTKIERVDKRLIDEFRDLSTSIVSDAMNRMNSMNAEINPIIRGFTVAGPAVTVQCMVGDNIMVHKAIYIAERGDIIVVDARGHKNTALWGYIMTKACKPRGIEAVVIDGSIRDIRENIQERYPIFCKGSVPAGSQKSWGGNINVPIQCGGVHVYPGDIIVGDDDGVVVVPKYRAETVLQKAKERIKMEEKWLIEMQKGKTTLEILGLDRKLDELKIETREEEFHEKKE
jgi:4-hydroxy-4-methyl-2-oxoglutarate aldolase